LRLILLCILAVGLNYCLNILSVFILKLPLFLDTVFTAVLAFAAGPLWGIAAAVLTTLAINPRYNTTAYVFRPRRRVPAMRRHSLRKRIATVRGGDTEPFSLISTFSLLLLLYIGDFVIVSVLGGIIDFVYYEILPGIKLHFSPEDTFKTGLLRSTMPILMVDIISRIPINIVDRFIVIFGGFFISRLVRNKNTQ